MVEDLSKYLLRLGLVEYGRSRRLLFPLLMDQLFSLDKS